MIHCDAPQGSDEWLEARRGVITGSRFRDARSKLKNGDPSKAALAYAMDIARERLGGTASSKFQTWAMRQGNEQEPIAAARYEQNTGNLVDECGFFVTEDGLFGLSPDRLIDDDGVLEIKTILSSDTLFTAVADGDVSDYMDQCNGYLWLLGRQWVDLALWVPDMDRLIIQRIERNEDAIEALESDMVAFSKLVQQYEDSLQQALDAARILEAA